MAVTGEGASTIPVAPWTEASRARVVVAMEAAELADRAQAMVPIVEGELRADGRVEYPGERIQAAAHLVFQAQQVLTGAVVAERLGGASWEQIGAALGVSRQAAHERYAAEEKRFRDELAHPENPDYTGEVGQFRYRLHPGARDPEGQAAELDAWVVRHRDDPDEDPNPVSRGLVRMDPDAELAALSDRRHALFREHTLPPATELLAILRRELVLWEQILAAGARRGIARDLAARTRRSIAELEDTLADTTADDGSAR